MRTRWHFLEATPVIISDGRVNIKPNKCTLSFDFVVITMDCMLCSSDYYTCLAIGIRKKQPDKCPILIKIFQSDWLARGFYYLYIANRTETPTKLHFEMLLILSIEKLQKTKYFSKDDDDTRKLLLCLTKSNSCWNWNVQKMCYYNEA